MMEKMEMGGGGREGSQYYGEISESPWVSLF